MAGKFKLQVLVKQHVMYCLGTLCHSKMLCLINLLRKSEQTLAR